MNSSSVRERHVGLYSTARRSTLLKDVWQVVQTSTFSLFFGFLAYNLSAPLNG